MSKEKNNEQLGTGKFLSVWPVIHLDGLTAATECARLAQRLGATGIFLISMDGRDADVIPAARAVHEACPGLKIGINLLGSGAVAALEASLQEGFDATWTDAPGISSAGGDACARACADILKEYPSHLFFASIAFKYQKEDPNPGVAGWEAARLGMIPTTSGAATGVPPTMQKLRAMRAAIGSGPFAVASGLDSSNVEELGQTLTHALVSTGIARSFHEFDPAKLEAFMNARARVNWGFNPRSIK